MDRWIFSLRIIGKLGTLYDTETTRPPQPQAPSLGDKAYLLDKEYREEFASM